MKNSLFILLTIILLTSVTYGQDADTTKKGWQPKGIAGLNISQISFKNWTQGGDNSLTYGLIGDFSLNKNTDDWAWKNSLKITYGQTKIGDEDFKTNENEFYLENVFSLKFGWAVDPYISNTVRTTVTAGYNYDGSTRTKIADVFDPGYITQSLGFTYDKLEKIQTRLGVAFQETFANQLKKKYTDDPKTAEIEDFKFETGIESVTDFNQEIDDNVLYKTKLRLFTRFDALDTWDVRWDNIFSAKVNTWLSVNLGVLVVYEKSQSLKTQVKEALQIGITYRLF